MIRIGQMGGGKSQVSKTYRNIAIFYQKPMSPPKAGKERRTTVDML